jgi:hypothetical protein
MTNPWVILGVVLAVIAAFSGGYYKGDEAGQAYVQQQWDKERADTLVKYTEEVEKAREKEQNWQQAADNIRQEKDRELKNLHARNTALANSLRERPDRPNDGAVPSTPSTGQSGCTGKELYREDGEFLVRIAREADELRAALKQCYAQYESVK